jgi:uncharacterized OB-fold protein
MEESLAITWRRIPERYRLLGTRCITCNGNYFPPRKICPKCRRKGKIENVQFTGKGKIYSFTTIFAPPSGFELEAPYVFAIVELDEGVRVTAQLVDCREEDVKIGSIVRMVFRRIAEDSDEGLLHYGFKFALVR